MPALLFIRTQYMKKIYFLPILIACLTIGWVSSLDALPSASTNFRLNSFVFSPGGISAASSGFKMRATMGQPSPVMDPSDPPLSFTYDLYPGFWYTLIALEPDTDGDGLFDTVELGSLCLKYDDADSDDDGIMDGVEDANFNGRIDPGETNPCDPDSDDDGILDGTEKGLTADDIGPDTDTGVFVPDADPATTTDPLDSDTDDDGIPDGKEDANHNGAVDAGETDPTSSNRPKAMPWIYLLLGE